MEKDDWKPIEGFEGRYECSKNGIIRSTDHYTYYKKNGLPMKSFYPGKLLIASMSRNNYVPYVSLIKKGQKKKMVKVAKYIIETFKGKTPMFHHIAYKDRDNCNVKLSNLYYARNKLRDDDFYRIQYLHNKELLTDDQIAELYRIGKRELGRILKMEGYEWQK